MEEVKDVTKYEYETDHGMVTLTPDIVRKYLVSGEGNITNGELAMFLNLCKYQKLNPFLREVYLIKYSNNSPASMVVGKDVHVKRASKNPNFDGMESGIIVTKGNGIIERAGSFTLPDEKIVGGWAIGHRKDWSTPRKVTVSWDEYKGTKANGELNKTWAKMPGTMMVKVAEAQCLRAMFPEELQALYNAEEMGKEPSELSQKPVPVGNGKTVEELRREIEQLLEDNNIYFEPEYAESVSAEAWSTENTLDLANILADMESMVKTAKRPEVKNMTDMGFKKASETHAKKAITRKEHEEPDTIPDAAPGDLDIF